MEVLVDGRNGPGVGAVHVVVPPGATMPEHDHGASETLLVPTSGTVRLIDVAAENRAAELAPGMIATIPRGRRVRLENVATSEASLIVVLSPPDFADQLNMWPLADSER